MTSDLILPNIEKTKVPNITVTGLNIEQDENLLRVLNERSSSKETVGLHFADTVLMNSESKQEDKSAD